MAPKRKKPRKDSKPKAAAKKSSGIGRRAVLGRLVKGGFATAAVIAGVSGFTLRDAVHMIMSMGTRTWTVYPIRPGQRTIFFSEGTYLLRPRADAPLPALYIRAGNWQFLGVYGQVTLPEGFPNVTIEPGVTQVAVVPSSSKPPKVGSTVWEPNLRITAPTGLRIIV